MPTFMVAALAVYAGELLIVRSPAFAARPGMLGPAVAFDLAAFVPALYWVLVMRRGGGSWLGFFAVLTLAWLLAPLVLPPAQRHYLAALLVLGPVAEAVSLGYAAVRVRRVARAYRAWTGDPRDVLARLRQAMAGGLGQAAVWRAFADELSMWRYAVAPPRRTAVETSAPGIHTYHRRSPWPAVVFAIAIMGAAETAGLHLLVALWSPRVAWLLTFSSVYALAWLVADVRACARRPLRMDPDSLLVRVGLRWTAAVPYRAIAAVEHARAATAPSRRAPGHLHAVPFGTPTLLLHLSGDVVAEGPYGLRRRVHSIALAPDDLPAFTAALAERVTPRA